MFSPLMRLKSSWNWRIFWFNKISDLLTSEKAVFCKCFALSEHSMVGSKPQFRPHILWTAPLKNLLRTITGDFVCNSQASCLGFKRRLEDTWTGLETTTNLTEHIFSIVFCLLFFTFIEPWSYHCLLLIVLSLPKNGVIIDSNKLF